MPILLGLTKSVSTESYRINIHRRFYWRIFSERAGYKHSIFTRRACQISMPEYINTVHSHPLLLTHTPRHPLTLLAHPTLYGLSRQLYLLQPYQARLFCRDLDTLGQFISSTVGWIGLTLFAFFEVGHNAAVQVYF